MPVNRKIKTFPEVLFEESSPVICDKTLLCYNTLYGVNVLLLTFRNVTDLRLYGLGISIDPLDEDGKRMLDEPIEYNYYGLNVAPGKTFGGNEEIVVEKEAASFEISVVRADLEEGENFRGPIVLEALHTPQPVEELEKWADPFVDRVHELNALANPRFVPERGPFYWRCTCGKVYPLRAGRCPACRLERDFLLDVLPELMEEARRQDEAERMRREERLRIEEEMRARQQEEARVSEIQREAARMAEERAQLQQQAAEEAAQEAARRAAEAEAERRRARKRQIAAIAVSFVVLGGCIFGMDKLITRAPNELAEPPAAAEPTAEPTAAPTAQPPAETVSYGPAVAAIGSGLTEEERRVVFRLIGISESDLEGFHLLPDTGNASGGARMLSSLLITPTAPGTGLEISLYNISTVTQETYAEALRAEGITDAEVIIAAPHQAVGTSALELIPLTAAYLHELAQAG